MKRLGNKLFRYLGSTRGGADSTPTIVRMGNEQTKLSLKREEPCPQPYYSFNNGDWEAISPSSPPSVSALPLPSHVRLISWNIDAMIPHGPVRMVAALDHLEELYSKTVATTKAPLLILLQEMTQPDLDLI